MATADKLDYLLETKKQIKEAIKGKGVGVEDADSFRSYASKIGQIEGGGTGQDGHFTDCIAYNVSQSNMGSYSYIFSQMIKKMPDELYNLIDMSKVTSMTRMFAYCFNLMELNLSSFDTSEITSIDYMCYSCVNLIEVKGILDVVKVTSLSNVFTNCRNLVEIRIKNLNCTGLNLGGCNKLSHDSLVYLINNLMASDTVKTITLGSTNLAKLTDEEKAIATNKNWTLS